LERVSEVNNIDVGGGMAPLVDVARLLRESVDATQIKHESIALDIDYSANYWARVLSCERGILLDRLGRLPVEVQRQLVTRWASALGLRIERRDTSARRAAVLALAQAASALAEEL